MIIELDDSVVDDAAGDVDIRDDDDVDTLMTGPDCWWNQG